MTVLNKKCYKLHCDFKDDFQAENSVIEIACNYEIVLKRTIA